jgi:hypothetical protein
MRIGAGGFPTVHSIFQMDDDQIARIHAQRWRFLSFAVGETVARPAVFLRDIFSRQTDFEHAVFAARVRRLANHALCLRSLTDFCRPLLSRSGQCAEAYEKNTEADQNTESFSQPEWNVPNA